VTIAARQPGRPARDALSVEAGWSPVIRLLLAATIGFFTASVALTVADLNGGGWVWTLPVSAVLMTVLLVLTSLGSAFAGTHTAGPDDAEAAVRENRVSLARVLDVRATGTTVNDQPLCEIRLVVASRTRPAYTTTSRSLVNLGRLASLQRGAVVVVAQLHPDRPDVALLDPAPGGWQAAADRDTAVAEMPEAPVWEPTPSRGRDARGLLRIPAVLLLVAFLVGFGVRVWPHRDAAAALLRGAPLSEVRADAERAAAEEASIFPAARTQQVVDDLAAAAAGTQFTEVTLYQTYAVAEALTAPGTQTTDSFLWMREEVTSQGAALIQPDPAELADELFDAAEVDWALVERLTAQMTELTGIDDVDGPMVLVRRATLDATTTPVEFTLTVDDDYRDAWVTADATGAVVSMRGGAPGSPSAAWEAGHAG
jgi:hypothetical protein